MIDEDCIDAPLICEALTDCGRCTHTARWEGWYPRGEVSMIRLFRVCDHHKPLLRGYKYWL